MDKQQDELMIIHTKLTFFPSLSNKRKAILRRNLLTEIAHPHNDDLIELDLYDNKIALTNGLEAFPNLKFLDLSFNLLKRNNIPEFKELTELYLIANDIEFIEPMNLPSLKKLDLAENSIKEIQNLNNLINLKELYLGNNFIEEVNEINLNLEVLDLQCNLIKEIDCKRLPNTLKTLMLNDITELEFLKNIECLTSLEFLGILRTKVDKRTIEGKNKAEIWH